jgi:hypothetical protein
MAHGGGNVKIIVSMTCTADFIKAGSHCFLPGIFNYKFSTQENAVVMNEKK